MQNSQPAIQVNNLGKCYHIYDKPQDRLKQAFSWNKKKYYREFWALQNISFEVEKGTALGIIGRNGSGKSTLLQMICKTLTPTTGTIQTNGRIAALLELGAGFNPEFSGRENVFLNGAILGFSQNEMNERFEDIQAFADIGNFIDQPVKTYSSGMFVRLAFAVQACTNPDILIIDEALSVGDIFFQQKCAARMQRMREQGTTLIFVSHDMGSIRDLCEQAVYLQHGKLLYKGPRVEAIRLYFNESHCDNIITNSTPLPISKKPESYSTTHFINTFKKSACWIAPPSDLPNKEAKILAISITDINDSPTMQTVMGNKLKFQLLYQSFTNNSVHITLALRNRYDHIINASGSYTNDAALPILKMGDYAVFELEVSCMLEAGSYTFCAFLSYNLLPNRGETLDESPWLGPITLTWDYENEKAPWLGMFGLPTKASFLTLTE